MGTKSGLVFQEVACGTCAAPKATDTVRVHYEGRLLNGTVFDSSFRRGQAAEFPLNAVIKGWTEGVQMMREGGRVKLTVPSELAYGADGKKGVIPPSATLIFEVELIKVL